MLTPTERHNIIRENEHLGLRAVEKALWIADKEHYIEEQNKYS